MEEEKTRKNKFNGCLKSRCENSSQRRLTQLTQAFRSDDLRRPPPVGANRSATYRPVARISAQPAGTSSSPVDSWLKRATVEDHAFLDRMGWRCEGQLAYLANELHARGEEISAVSLHEEGLRQGVQLLKEGHNPYYRNTLLSPYADRKRLLECDSTRLSAATNPACLNNPDAPVLWGAEQWAAMQARQATEQLFDWDKVLAQFDRAAYERDGYCAFAGIMTQETQEQWAEALRQCQRLNDRLLLSDFSKLDWEAFGLSHAPCGRLRAEEIETALGTAQAWPQRTDECGVRTLRQHGVISECVDHDC